MHTGFKTNEYQQAIAPKLYERTPKAVFAALAASFAAHYIHNGDLSKIDEALLEEWRILYEQGIVPQRPPTIEGIK